RDLLADRALPAMQDHNALVGEPIAHGDDRQDLAEIEAGHEEPAERREDDGIVEEFAEIGDGGNARDGGPDFADTGAALFVGDHDVQYIDFESPGMRVLPNPWDLCSLLAAEAAELHRHVDDIGFHLH